MGYSSKAVVLIGYPLDLKEHKKSVKRCPSSKQECFLMKSDVAFCPDCGKPREALNTVTYPNWIDEDINCFRLNGKVGIYRLTCEEERYFLGVIVARSDGQFDLSEIKIGDEAERIKTWMKERQILINGEPKLYVHLYESY